MPLGRKKLTQLQIEILKLLKTEESSLTYSFHHSGVFVTSISVNKCGPRTGNLKQPRNSHGTVLIGDELFVAGGWGKLLNTEICKLRGGKFSCEKQEQSTSSLFPPQVFPAPYDFCSVRANLVIDDWKCSKCSKTRNIQCKNEQGMIQRLDNF